MTDRYVMYGLQVPVIVPPGLTHLKKLMGAAMSASAGSGTTVKIDAIDGNTRRTIRAYSKGEDVSYLLATDDDEETE